MTIIHTKRFVHYDERGNRTEKVYRISDTPEFFCQSGLHAWCDEQDAGQCCRDGFTQILISGKPYLASQEAIDRKEAVKSLRRDLVERDALNNLFGGDVQITDGNE